MQHLKFRLAEKIDLAEIQKLFVATIKDSCSKDYSDEQIGIWIKSVEHKERWRGFVDEQYFLLAELDYKIVGFASLDNKETEYTDFMYVHKDYLRRGIANSLFRIIEKENFKRGGKKNVSDVSITAKPFFKNVGFKILKKNRNKKKNGIELINYRMLKEYNQS